MAVWSTTYLSSIKNSFGRFDAEFYKPENLIAFEKVTSKKHAQLKALTLDGYRVVYENTKILPPGKVTNKSVLFLQATNIAPNGLSIDKSSIGFVSEADWVRYPKGRIKPGELLIEVKGQAEKVTVVPETFPTNTLVSGSLFKLTIDSEKISPWYVFSYFSTQQGKLLRDRLKCYVSVDNIPRLWRYLVCEEAFSSLSVERKEKLKC
jgi:type I restriction enzyme S subunit